MKTVIINGSPRKNGDSMTLVNELTKYLDGEVQIVNTYFDNIKPCIDCRHCWNNPACSIKDDMQDVYELLKDADNIVISSPVYFSELTGQVLNFASRLQLFYMSKRMNRDIGLNNKIKNGLLIVTAGGDTKNIEERVIKTSNLIFRYINAKSIGTIYSINTDNVPAQNDVTALEKAREFALKLNILNI